MTRFQRILLTFSLFLNITFIVCLVSVPILFPPPEGPYVERAPSSHHRDGDGPHNHAGPGDRDGSGRRGGPKDGRGRPPFPPDVLASLIVELDVNDEQRATIEAEIAMIRESLPDYVSRLHNSRGEIVKSLLLDPENTTAAREAEEEEVALRRELSATMHDHLRNVSLALTPEQRSQLAERLEEVHRDMFGKRIGLPPSAEPDAEPAE